MLSIHTRGSSARDGVFSLQAVPRSKLVSVQLLITRGPVSCHSLSQPKEAAKQSNHVKRKIESRTKVPAAPPTLPPAALCPTVTFPHSLRLPSFSRAFCAPPHPCSFPLAADPQAARRCSRGPVRHWPPLRPDHLPAGAVRPLRRVSDCSTDASGRPNLFFPESSGPHVGAALGFLTRMCAWLPQVHP